MRQLDAQLTLYLQCACTEIKVYIMLIHCVMSCTLAEFRHW